MPRISTSAKNYSKGITDRFEKLIAKANHPSMVRSQFAIHNIGKMVKELTPRQIENLVYHRNPGIRKIAAACDINFLARLYLILDPSAEVRTAALDGLKENRDKLSPAQIELLARKVSNPIKYPETMQELGKIIGPLVKR